jgi:hypothetical protein
MNKRQAGFQQYNADSQHQHVAGVASWCAFSARWRARQGLPLLHPMDVQFLTPQDFCNGHGQPLSPTEQRRLFRQYVAAALHLSQEHKQEGWQEHGGRVAVRRPLVQSGDLAFVRADGFVRSRHWRPDFAYGGRADVKRYESEALAPTRLYGIPLTSEGFPGYWLDGDGLMIGEEEW